MCLCECVYPVQDIDPFFNAMDSIDELVMSNQALAVDAVRYRGIFQEMKKDCSNLLWVKKNIVIDCEKVITVLVTRDFESCHRSPVSRIIYQHYSFIRSADPSFNPT